MDTQALLTYARSLADELEQGLIWRTLEGSGRAAERDLHARFRHLRIHGAWFLPEPELLAHIEEIVEPPEPQARASTSVIR